MNQNRKSGLVAFVGLIGAFIAFRFPLLPLHGMKAWPLDLMILGAIVIGIAIINNKKLVPLFTLNGYIIGFNAAYLFQFDYGNGLNSFWIIWSIIFFCFILLAFFLEKKVTNK